MSIHTGFAQTVAANYRAIWRSLRINMPPSIYLTQMTHKTYVAGVGPRIRPSLNRVTMVSHAGQTHNES
jgi:hypothetical protein